MVPYIIANSYRPLEIIWNPNHAIKKISGRLEQQENWLIWECHRIERVSCLNSLFATIYVSMGNEPKSVKTSYASHDCKKELRRTKELFNSSVCDGSKGEYNGLQTH